MLICGSVLNQRSCRFTVRLYTDRDSVISGLCSASVQIVRLDRTMEQIVFPVPNICEFLTQESKLRVYYSTERDEQGSKINDFFLSSEDLFNEMNWQKKLRGTQEVTSNTNTVPCTSFYSLPSNAKLLYFPRPIPPGPITDITSVMVMSSAKNSLIVFTVVCEWLMRDSYT